MSSELFYDASARGHLKRAKDCLLNPDVAYLFYAALNLRFCVEERQDEYVQAQKRYMKSVPRAHKIGHQSAALKRIFNCDSIGQFKVEFQDIVEPVVLHFTPVTAELKTAAQRLGDILHVRESAPAQTDPWWTETRAELVRVYRLAWIACQGEMLCPMIRDKNGGVVGMITITDTVDRSFFDRMGEIGRKGILTVDYIESLPGAIPDL